MINCLHPPEDNAMIKISEAHTEAQIDAIRRLMRAFVEWHYKRHDEYHDLINNYFDAGNFDSELANLPGDFASPQGSLLLASEGKNEAGCVALHDLGSGICEMKRMFVNPEFHGKGVGLQLAEAIISKAKNIGYHTMRLDTGPKQKEAQGLYRRLGFKDIKPYYELGEEMRDWLVFMELDLEK